MAATEIRIDCGEQLDISAAGGLHTELSGALDRGQPVSIDVSRLDQVDTAGAQLLLAFTREAGKKGIRVDWLGDPACLRDAAQRLGVASDLALPDG